MNRKGRKTLSDYVKEFGAFITKNFAGYYTYHGKNFTVDFNQASCESTWWEIDEFSENIDIRVSDYFKDYNNFSSKGSLVEYLLNFDKSLSQNK